MDIYEESLKLHKEKKGKIEIRSKIALNTKKELSLAYTPGVAEVSRAIAKDPEKIFDYTMKGNSVAIVTDGSAVLGLGNIGPGAALPVMEGKAVLFKEFANIDAFPICVKTQDPKEIVNIAKNIAPAFGGINLEDISAPRCFEIEEALQNIGIPVMHDDQHGTAIVILAALINAAKVVNKPLDELRVVISGAGAAGTATTKLLLCLGYDKKICTSVKSIVVLDSRGAIHSCRENLPKDKRFIARYTNAKCEGIVYDPNNERCRTCIRGGIVNAVKNQDVFIGVSVGNILTEEMVKSMAEKTIIFAMANPVPEISPEDAKAGGAAVVGTGRSDLPNQINNVLAFPGVFRGALDSKAVKITNEMKLAAAYALADCIKNPTPEKIVPDALDKSVAKRVADAVKKAAIEGGVVRK